MIMKALHIVTFILVIVGALNWGVYALTGWEIGQVFGGMDATVSMVIYILVGLSAIWLIITHKKECRVCSGSSM